MKKINVLLIFTIVVSLFSVGFAKDHGPYYYCKIVTERDKYEYQQNLNILKAALKRNEKSPLLFKQENTIKDKTVCRVYSQNNKIEGWEYRADNKAYILVERDVWEDVYKEIMYDKATRLWMKLRDAKLVQYIITKQHTYTHEEMSLWYHYHMPYGDKHYTLIYVK